MSESILFNKNQNVGHDFFFWITNEISLLWLIKLSPVILFFL